MVRMTFFTVLMLMATWSGLSNAQEAESDQTTPATEEASEDSSDETPDEPSEEPRRRHGFGTATGGGFTSVQVHTFNDNATDSPIVHTFNFPTFEASFFLLRKLSVEISFPLADTIVQSILARAFYFEFDAFFTLHFGSRRIKALVSPGVGLELLASSDDFGVLPKIPFRVGMELLTRRHRLSLRVMMRPFISLGYLSIEGLEDGFNIGGGLLGEIAIMYYGLRD